MTFDMVAFCREQPDTTVLIAAMHATGSELKVNTIEEAHVNDSRTRSRRVLNSTRYNR